MREIKFRAWDSEMGQMVYSDGRNRNEWQVHYYFNIGNGLRCSWIEDYDDPFGYPVSRGGELDNIMQYTGLKDKNGVEIYEGDILRECDNWVTVVFWNTERGAWFVENFFEGYDNWNSPLYGTNALVIGNIHENSELLEVCTNGTR